MTTVGQTLGVVFALGAAVACSGSAARTVPVPRPETASRSETTVQIESAPLASRTGDSARSGASSGGPELKVCTQNLWNYGLAADVRRLRRPEASLASVKARLERQERALVERLGGCDVIAVQELVGDDDARARTALERLGRLLEERTGHPYAVRTADTRDVIRNGFLFREDAAFAEAGFEGRHTKDTLPAVRGFPRAHWDRGPAELVLDLRPRRRIAAAGGAKGRDRYGRIRVITAHLKSKSERGRSVDPNGEKWERVRVVQARALLDLARRRRDERPGELILVAGDLNNDRGKATRAVLAGVVDPVSLLDPRDCIDPSGGIACDLPLRSPDLIDLAGLDPDLRGRGSYRFSGKEELIDGVFATSDAARAARESRAHADDYDVELIGRFGEGSDHRMLRATLRF